MKRIAALKDALKHNESLQGFHIYFIGIGGIGMSAIARFFLWKGASVAGYDRHASELTLALEGEGASIHYADDTKLLDQNTDVVVYTPAIPVDMGELAYYRNAKYDVLKRSEILQIITEGSFNICIAGTHGKSTTTTLIAHILRDSLHGCNAFLGAISVNYDTNFWGSDKHVCVVEADEFDRSFLRLSPNVAVITAMDADHLDIYGTVDAVQEAYVQFSQRIRKGGCLINKLHLKRGADLNADFHFTYSLDDTVADFYASDIRVIDGTYHYDVHTPSGWLRDVMLRVGGYHNIENSIAAIAIARFLKIDDASILKAVASFQGVKRRFEFKIRNAHHVLIDDYAHHPAEIKALLHGVKTLYPDEKITVVFQPHLYSRTKDLADGFAESLDLGDEVILLPIYPARELPIPGSNSELILGKMHCANKIVLSKEEMLQKITAEKPKILVMCGAGDIDALVDPVKKILEA